MKRLILILLSATTFAFSTETRTWTSADGSKSFEGEMMEFSETEVRIKRTADFKTFAMPLDALSAEDREYIDGLLREQKRDTALKDGPYAALISGGFVQSESANGLKFQLFGNPKWKGSDRIPLLIWLHGAGQSGDDNQAQMGGATKAFGSEESQEEYPCFILAPQCPSRDIGWKDAVEANLVALITDLVENLPIDETRVYLTGSSMGGFGSWRLATDQPERFAAVVPICGGGNPGDAEKLKDIPIWAFHGDQDDQVSVDKSREMFQAIQAIGGKQINYTELPGEGHLIAGGVYAREDLAPWIFAQKRGSAVE